MTTINNNGYVVTGDNNIALMKVSVKYTITDPVNYALNIKDVDKIIDACVSNAMLERAACTDFDDILTSGKEKYSLQVKNVAQQSLDNNSVGVTLSTVELTTVAPPQEVKAIYDSVNAATVDAEKILKEADQYAEQTKIAANASAEKLISAANTTYSQNTSKANADLAEFWGTLEEYERSAESREVVRARIKSDKLSKAISNIGKVIAVKDGDSHIIIN
jgi:membrane protease subunit HflK